ncbi:MAG: NADH-quinone oxidoreductase subunit L [Spirochaetes bacterium]|nr:MAG: NADH-quinone oxidoreductase subunit L [Spirochaetota bacterium]
MSEFNLILPIAVPLAAGLLVLPFKAVKGTVHALVTFGVAAFTLALSLVLFGSESALSIPWAPFGLDFSLRLYSFSGFILVAASGFGTLISLYAAAFMRGKEKQNQFFGYFLLTMGLVNGAVLSDNLLLMLFFWEGLLVPLYGMIAIGSPKSYRTATKALIIVGLSDLCMMLGIAIVYSMTDTLTISKISVATGSALGSAAFVLMAIGAVSKAGSIPFHSWIPDAARAAALPFMAILPASLEKLLGIYFLSRICLDLFALTPDSWLSTLLMALGCVTIIVAVLMALIQKEYKRLLSYHAISQVGYMVLGIGTAVPIGIMGGIFHMINHAIYKSCLFLTGGAVEHRAGTTELDKLGGLRASMPVTCICFLVAAASISGVPPFNGFFSKEMVYAGALARGPLFYIFAVIGSFFTAASFLKLGHAVYFDPKQESAEKVREAPLAMLVPMIVLALLCVAFGVWNAWPIETLIAPSIAASGAPVADAHGGAGIFLIVMTCVALGGAVLNHLSGFKITHRGLTAVDHIHDTPGLSWAYDRAENRYNDFYDLGKKALVSFAKTLWKIDRAIDWIFEHLAGAVAFAFTARLRALQTGNYSLYIVFSLLGAAAVVAYLVQ